MTEKVLAAVRTAAETTEFQEFDMPDIPDDASVLVLLGDHPLLPSAVLSMMIAERDRPLHVPMTPTFAPPYTRSQPRRQSSSPKALAADR